jgi:hypothetical protein
MIGGFLGGAAAAVADPLDPPLELEPTNILPNVDPETAIFACAIRAGATVDIHGKDWRDRRVKPRSRAMVHVKSSRVYYAYNTIR